MTVLEVYQREKSRKEDYIQEANRRIKEAGMTKVLKINPGSFGVRVREQQVRIYLDQVRRDKNRKEWAKAKKIEGFEETIPLKYSIGNRNLNPFYYGCIILPIKEEDHEQN